jgi:hypothetical protein
MKHILVSSIPFSLLRNVYLQLVGETSRVVGPGAIEARSISMATTNSVSTDQSNSFLNSETHARDKDVENVILTQGTVGKTANRGAFIFTGLITTTTGPFNVRTTHVFNSNTTSKASREGLEFSLKKYNHLLLTSTNQHMKSTRTWP